MFSQTDLSDANFDKKVYTKNDKLIVVEFSATWCGYCRYMKPILKELSADYKNNVEFYIMDIDKNKKDDQFERTGVPSFYLFHNGEIVDTIGGALDKEGMEWTLDKVIKDNNIPDKPKKKEVKISDSYLIDIWDNDWRELNAIAWYTYKNENDKNRLSLTIKAIKQSININKNYYNMDTYAALLYKTKKYEKALKVASLAVELAQEDNLDDSSTLELIQSINLKINKIN